MEGNASARLHGGGVVVVTGLQDFGGGVLLSEDDLRVLGDLEKARVDFRATLTPLL